MTRRGGPKPPLYLAFGKMLKTRMEEVFGDDSIREVARLLGVSPNHVVQWRCGRRLPSMRLRPAVAILMGWAEGAHDTMGIERFLAWCTGAGPRTTLREAEEWRFRHGHGSASNDDDGDRKHERQ